VSFLLGYPKLTSHSSLSSIATLTAKFVLKTNRSI
jgi:hypothetical protein